MDYNTQRKQLRLPEYGRNVQQMVDHLLTIEDRATRTAQAKLVVRAMLAILPQMRNIENYEQKLWDHLYVMSGFALEVDAPYPPPTPEDLDVPPRRVPYPDPIARPNHYGTLIPAMLRKIASMPEGSERLQLASMTANQMKRNYLQWNKSAVTDAEILDDLHHISKGQLSLPDDIVLTSEVPPAATKGATRPAAPGTNRTGKRTNKRRRRKKH